MLWCNLIVDQHADSALGQRRSNAWAGSRRGAHEHWMHEHRRCSTEQLHVSEVQSAHSMSRP